MIGIAPARVAQMLGPGIRPPVHLVVDLGHDDPGVDAVRADEDGDALRPARGRRRWPGPRRGRARRGNRASGTATIPATIRSSQIDRPPPPRTPPRHGLVLARRARRQKERDARPSRPDVPGRDRRLPPAAGCCRRHLPAPPEGAPIVLALGKAAGEMAQVAEAHYRGKAIGRRRRAARRRRRSCERIELLHAGHPVPDEASVAAAERLLALAGAPGRTISSSSC